MIPIQDDDLETEDQEAPPDGEGDDSEDGEGGKGGFDARKIILFVVLPLLVIAGIGAGLFMSGVLGGGAEEDTGAAEHHEEAKAHKPSKKDDGHGGGHGDGHGGGGPAFLEIPPMIVNLATDDGTPRYLRLSVQLEMATQEDQAAVEAVLPRVVDQFQTYLRELRVKDLVGSAGIYRLQMELLSRVNQAASPVEVKDVLFQEILIQ